MRATPWWRANPAIWLQLGFALALIGGCTASPEMDRPGRSERRPSVGSEAAVTNVELDEAFASALACIRDKGISSEVVHDGIGGLQIRSSASTPKELDTLQQQIDMCLDEFFRPLANRYLQLYGPTLDEQRSSERGTLACLRSRGVSAASIDEALRALDAREQSYPQECFDAAHKQIRDAVRARAAE